MWTNIILQAFPILWRYTELTYTVHMLSILYTVCGVVSVLLNYSKLYKTGMNIVI